jgi:A/G-specific adenine glycosylase
VPTRKPSKSAQPKPAQAESAAALTADLVAWFRKEGKDYPWRRTHDPYAVLVSEIMLQQTQIATVLDRGFYARWMEKFPDFQTLAAASESEVLGAWQGLGYYRRARNLHKLAQVIVSDHGGVFPRDPEVIRSLPGIGPYTAGAISSFAFGLAEPIVDGNIARVLSRLDNDATSVDSTPGIKRLWDRAKELVQATEDPRALNSALMELGQTICKPTRPACDACLVHHHCLADEPETLPVKGARPEITEVIERVFFLRTGQGILLEQETGSRRTGLWKLPALPEEFSIKPPSVLLKTTYGITRYKVTLWVHEVPGKPAQTWPESHRLVPLDELPALPMPSPYRRALERLLASSGEFRLE